MAWVWTELSRVATITFALLLVPTGVFAWAWTRRMRKLAVNVGGRMAAWMKLDGVARVGEAQNVLIERMERMRERYRAEVLGWGPVEPHRGVFLWRSGIALVVVGSVVLALFVFALRKRSVTGLPQAPSPWHAMRDEDPAVVTDRLERDARGAAAAIGELDRLEEQMRALRAAFSRGERSYYSQEDQDAIHRLLLTYINLRTALLRTVWTYRGAHDDPAPGLLETRAFLLAYASAATLLEKADVIVTTFANDEEARRKLNEGDLSWDIPEGTYDRLRAGLASATVVSELRQVLRPGDILLERRNWFMSNAFLPGFFPHAAIYLGDSTALAVLGVNVNDDPRVIRNWNAFLARDAAGHPHAVIEAVSEGVIFTSLEHSVGEADAVAVLRPRLTDGQRREAIARAFSHYGKPYDFEFDFFSTDRLVYRGGLPRL